MGKRERRDDPPPKGWSPLKKITILLLALIGLTGVILLALWGANVFGSDDNVGTGMSAADPGVSHEGMANAELLRTLENHNQNSSNIAQRLDANGPSLAAARQINGNALTGGSGCPSAAEPDEEVRLRDLDDPSPLFKMTQDLPLTSITWKNNDPPSFQKVRLLSTFPEVTVIDDDEKYYAIKITQAKDYSKGKPERDEAVRVQVGVKLTSQDVQGNALQVMYWHQVRKVKDINDWTVVLGPGRWDKDNTVLEDGLCDKHYCPHGCPGWVTNGTTNEKSCGCLEKSCGSGYHTDGNVCCPDGCDTCTHYPGSSMCAMPIYNSAKAKLTSPSTAVYAEISPSDGATPSKSKCYRLATVLQTSTAQNIGKDKCHAQWKKGDQKSQDALIEKLGIPAITRNDNKGGIVPDACGTMYRVSSGKKPGNWAQVGKEGEVNREVYVTGLGSNTNSQDTAKGEWPFGGYWFIRVATTNSVNYLSINCWNNLMAANNQLDYQIGCHTRVGEGYAGSDFQQAEYGTLNACAINGGGDW